MTAVAHKTAPQPTAPWVLPGNYSVVLTTGGKSLTQPLAVKMDPRVKASTADLMKQFELSKELYDLRAELQPIGKSYEALVAELTKAKERAGESPIREQIEGLRKKLETFANPAAVRSNDPLELDVLNKVEKLFGDLQEVDAAPTPSQQAAVTELQKMPSSADGGGKRLRGKSRRSTHSLRPPALARSSFHSQPGDRNDSVASRRALNLEAICQILPPPER